MRILIVGGYGKMGRWFAKFFTKYYHSVRITGRRIGPLRKASRELGLPIVKPRTVCEWADCAILSVPPKRVEEVANEYDRLLRKDCLIVDISSVKSHLIGFLRSSKRPVLSIHPFFGPGTESLKGRSVAVIFPEKPKGRSRELLNCFRDAGAEIVHCSPRIHDRVILYTLALPHLLAALYGSLIVNSGIEPRKLEKLGGTSYRILSSLARSSGSESPEVYASIQLADLSYDKILGRALKTLKNVRTELREGRSDTFLKLLQDSSKVLLVGRI
ncbi:MAG: prephenate dehydrogenase/arogenate dehydrogenase family protein [Thermoproteota archaeon]